MRIIEADLNKLREKISLISRKADAAIALAMAALLHQDSSLAQEVIAADDEIDHLENEICQLATDVMVLRQPVANDLRFTITILQTASVIERIADHAVNIAKHVCTLNQEPPLKPYIDLPRMSEITQEMICNSIQALNTGDVELARTTIKNDDLVDELYHKIYDELLDIMQQDGATVKRGSELLFIIKHMERIADYATNICEMVIYMIEGRVIKHTQEAL
jgi:phosphate transport system protein